MGYFKGHKGQASSNPLQAGSNQKLSDVCLIYSVFQSKARCLAVGHVRYW